MEKKKSGTEPAAQTPGPVVIMGGKAFSLSELLDMDNRPEIKSEVEAWLTAKEKASGRSAKKKSNKGKK